jgi:hypothetical protein
MQVIIVFLLRSVDLAQDNRRGGRAEARHDVFKPLRCGSAEPAAVLAATGAVQLAGMRPLPGAEGSDVAAARMFAVHRAV